MIQVLFASSQSFFAWDALGDLSSPAASAAFKKKSNNRDLLDRNLTRRKIRSSSHGSSLLFCEDNTILSFGNTKTTRLGSTDLDEDESTSLRRGLDAQATILEGLEVQRARENRASDARAMLGNLRRIARQPLARNVAPAEVEETGNNNEVAPRGTIFAATLSANPRSLNGLWEEYERGIGGRRIKNN
jgi:hypothetical protein